MEHDVGWVVTPGKAGELANAVVRAASSNDAQRAERAIEIAKHFDFNSLQPSHIIAD